LVAETDGAGVKLIDDLDTTQLRTLTDSVDSDTTLTKLSHQFDAGTVDSRHLDEVSELLDSGDMDGADLRRFSELLDKRDSDELIDDSIEADDLLDIADDGELSATQLVVKDKSGSPRWLEKGAYAPDGSQKSSGWAYLKARHIDGKQLEEKQATDFWPVGQTVKSEKLPDTMSETDIRKAIYEAIDNRETTRQDAIEYGDFDSQFVSNTGVSRVRVIVRDGKIRTAFPKKGPKVWKYVSEDDVGWIK